MEHHFRASARLRYDAEYPPPPPRCGGPVTGLTRRHDLSGRLGRRHWLWYPLPVETRRWRRFRSSRGLAPHPALPALGAGARCRLRLERAPPPWTCSRSGRCSCSAATCWSTSLPDVARLFRRRQSSDLFPAYSHVTLLAASSKKLWLRFRSLASGRWLRRAIPWVEGMAGDRRATIDGGRRRARVSHARVRAGPGVWIERTQTSRPLEGRPSYGRPVGDGNEKE